MILNGTTIVSNYFNSQNDASQPLSAYFSSADIDLVQGQLYYIEIKYADKNGLSKIKLLWESDSQPFTIVDSKSLFNKLNSQTTPYSFTVIPASSNQTLSYLANQ